MKKFFITFSIIFIAMLMYAVPSFAKNYYVSNSGNDSNSGTSASSPWKTINFVNNYKFNPGDVVHFKSGDIWREQLIPVSGSKKGNVTYTSYGSDEKPSFYGSVSKSKPEDWKQISKNIWTLNSTGYNTVGKISQDKFWLWQENGAEVNFDGNMDKNGCITIDCTKNGSTSGNIQLNINDVKIEDGKNYKLTFSAKSTKTFNVAGISLMKSNTPWTSSYSYHSDLTPSITTEWEDYSIEYTANCTDTESRITIFLGSVIPEGSTLYMKDISFASASDAKIFSDVGNIILNNGQACGVKAFNEDQMDSQNDFWYDKNNNLLEFYSTSNPAEIYNSIECALSDNIIEQSNKSYVTYSGLDIRYGGAHGIGGTNTQYIKILNCDISYIGGGELDNYYKSVRYGNGIEFWGNAHDNLVSGCKIWEIYDAALTNQGDGDGTLQYNITYTNNKVWNSEMSFEYWNRGKNSKTYGIRFENNTCSNAGKGWGHSQRLDPFGVHIMFYSNTAETTNFIVANNSFDYAEQCSVNVSSEWNGIKNLQMKNNSYIQPKEKVLVMWQDKAYFTNSVNILSTNRVAISTLIGFNTSVDKLAKKKSV